MDYLEIARSVMKNRPTVAAVDHDVARVCVQCNARGPILVEIEAPVDSVLAKERAAAERRTPRAETIALCSGCWLGRWALRKS